jgi:hypothetical protein
MNELESGERGKEQRGMKAPKTLSYDFDIMPSCEYQDITEFYKGAKHQYIRRDVVERAMWRLMADWKHFIHADTIDKYIEDAIKDADNADND